MVIKTADDIFSELAKEYNLRRFLGVNEEDIKDVEEIASLKMLLKLFSQTGLVPAYDYLNKVNLSLDYDSTDYTLSINLLLTSRQKDIIELISIGYSNNKIASELGIKRRTVERHIGELFNSLLDNNIRNIYHNRVICTLLWKARMNYIEIYEFVNEDIKKLMDIISNRGRTKI